MDEILRNDIQIKGIEASCGTVYYTVRGGFKFHGIYIKATKQYYPVMVFVWVCRVILIFESVDEILKFEHSNESY